MKKEFKFELILILTVLSALVGCASKQIASKREARIHLEAKKKVGLVSIKQYPIDLKNISISTLPDESASPINEAAIEKRYKKEAAEWPVSTWAPITRDFNEGRISEAAYVSRHRFAIFAALAVLNQRNSSAFAPPYGFPLAFAPTTMNGNPTPTSSYPAFPNPSFSPSSNRVGSSKAAASYPVAPGPSFSPSNNKYNPNSLANPYGAGSPYKADGLMNPYSQYGSQYSNKSWRNPYATEAPMLYDAQGKYMGNFSSNQYDPNSVSNPYGKYGNPYSPSSINNPFGAGNPYSNKPIYVVPRR